MATDIQKIIEMQEALFNELKKFPEFVTMHSNKTGLHASVSSPTLAIYTGFSFVYSTSNLQSILNKLSSSQLEVILKEYELEMKVKSMALKK